MKQHGRHTERRHAFLILFAIVTALSRLSAQTPAGSCNNQGCCCDNDPTPAGVMISHVHEKREFMISYRYMSMNMDGIANGRSIMPASKVLSSYASAPDLMQMNMHMLMGMYGVTSRLTVMAMFNYASNYMEMDMSLDARIHRHSMSSAGISDTRIYALWALHSSGRSQFLLSAGANLPTGSVDVRGERNSEMYPGQRLPYSMQLGSGSFDLLPGLTYLYQDGKLTMSSQLTGIVRTRNTLGYRLGNEAAFSCWGAWQCLPWLNGSVRVSGTLTEQINGSDGSLEEYSAIDANPRNYGGEFVSAFIGAGFQAKKGLLRNNRLGIEYGIPAFYNVNGYQARPSSSLYLAWSVKI